MASPCQGSILAALEAFAEVLEQSAGDGAGDAFAEGAVGHAAQLGRARGEREHQEDGPGGAALEEIHRGGQGLAMAESLDPRQGFGQGFGHLTVAGLEGQVAEAPGAARAVAPGAGQGVRIDRLIGIVDRVGRRLQEGGDFQPKEHDHVRRLAHDVLEHLADGRAGRAGGQEDGLHGAFLGQEAGRAPGHVVQGRADRGNARGLEIRADREGREDDFPAGPTRIKRRQFGTGRRGQRFLREDLLLGRRGGRRSDAGRRDGLEDRLTLGVLDLQSLDGRGDQKNAGDGDPDVAVGEANGQVDGAAAAVDDDDVVPGRQGEALVGDGDAQMAEAGIPIPTGLTIHLAQDVAQTREGDVLAGCGAGGRLHELRFDGELGAVGQGHRGGVGRAGRRGQGETQGKPCQDRSLVSVHPYSAEPARARGAGQARIHGALVADCRGAPMSHQSRKPRGGCQSDSGTRRRDTRDRRPQGHGHDGHYGRNGTGALCAKGHVRGNPERVS